MSIGAESVVVLEPDELRREVLAERWANLRLDIVAKAFDCQINLIGTEQVDEYTPELGFVRVLSTECFLLFPSAS